MNKKKIAILEDNYVMSKNLEEILCINDFNVEIFRSISRARADLSRYNPDLIIADLNLADGHAGEYISELRSNKKFHYKPIIIMTGLLDINELHYLDIGVSKIILKPADSRLLIRIIKRLLNKPSIYLFKKLESFNNLFK